MIIIIENAPESADLMMIASDLKTLDLAGCQLIDCKQFIAVKGIDSDFV